MSFDHGLAVIGVQKKPLGLKQAANLTGGENNKLLTCHNAAYVGGELREVRFNNALRTRVPLWPTSQKKEGKLCAGSRKGGYSATRRARSDSLMQKIAVAAEILGDE